MLRRLRSWLRDRIAVDDLEDRIEGSGDPITPPQHRRSAEAERLLREADVRPEDDRFERRRDDDRRYR